MQLPPQPGDPPRTLPPDVLGDPPPLTEAEMERARTEPDPAFFDVDPDA